LNSFYSRIFCQKGNAFRCSWLDEGEREKASRRGPGPIVLARPCTATGPRSFRYCTPRNPCWDLIRVKFLKIFMFALELENLPRQGSFTVWQLDFIHYQIKSSLFCDWIPSDVRQFLFFSLIHQLVIRLNCRIWIVQLNTL